MNTTAKGFFKIIVTMLIITASIYALGYAKWNNQKFEDDYSQYFEEEPQIKEETIDAKEIEKVYSSINYQIVQENFGSEFIDFYYKRVYTSPKNLSNDFIIYIATINLLKNNFLVSCNNVNFIKRNELEDKINEIFGQIDYEDKTINIENDFLKIEYNPANFTYTITNSKCSGIPFGEGYIKTEIANSKYSNNILEIVEYVYFVSYSYDEVGNYILNYHNGFNAESEIIGTNKNELDKTKLKKYKYTFEKTITGKYQFISLEIEE